MTIMEGLISSIVLICDISPCMGKNTVNGRQYREIGIYTGYTKIIPHYHSMILWPIIAIIISQSKLIIAHYTRGLSAYYHILITFLSPLEEIAHPPLAHLCNVLLLAPCVVTRNRVWWHPVWCHGEQLRCCCRRWYSFHCVDAKLNCGAFN